MSVRKELSNLKPGEIPVVRVFNAKRTETRSFDRNGDPFMKPVYIENMREQYLSQISRILAVTDKVRVTAYGGRNIGKCLDVVDMIDRNCVDNKTTTLDVMEYPMHFSVDIKGPLLLEKTDLSVNVVKVAKSKDKKVKK